MRLVIAAAAVALLLGDGGASAQPVSTQPLAANEVLAQTVGTGIVTRPATSARLLIQLSAGGSTVADARQELRTTTARVSAALQRIGIAPADISPDGGMRMGFVGNADYADTDQAISAMLPSGGSPNRQSTICVMTVLLRDPTMVDRVIDAAQDAGAGNISPPTYRPDDDRAAQTEARAAALRDARQQADAFASALSMRVARIVRVGETPEAAGGSGWTLYANMMNAIGLGEARKGEVQTRAVVAADFALAPR